MLVTVKEDVRRYHVGFEIDNSVKFEKGSNKGRPQTVTTCKIYLMPDVRGRRPTYIAGGTTVLGKKDTPDHMEGLKHALTRALKQAKLGRYVNSLIWADFQTTHRRIDTVKPSCAEAFSDVAPSFAPHAWIAPATKRAATAAERIAKRLKASVGEAIIGGPVHGYGGLHSFQKKAIRKYPWQVAGAETFGTDRFKAMYIHNRHEYHDIAHKDLGKSPTGRATRIYAGSGKTVDVRRLAGLGWTRIVVDHTGEQIWPRTKAVEAFCQAENTLDTKALEAAMDGAGVGAKRVQELIKEADLNKKRRQWLHGLWAVADDQLTAKMRKLSNHYDTLEEFEERNADLLSRPGITKVHDEYLIDPSVFVSEFKVGDTVTWVDGGLAKITEVDTVRVTIQPVLRTFGGRTAKFGGTETVMDWEVKKNVHWLRRFWTWLDAGISEVSEPLPKIIVKPDVPYVSSLEDGEALGRKLWNLIQDNYCDACHGSTIWRQGPSGGGCSNIKCKSCGQKYWIDPASRTASKI